MDLIEITRRQIAEYEQAETVDARDLHQILEIGKDFSTWIKTQIDRAKLVRGTHYVTLETTPPKGGVVRTQYFLTVDAAKHVAMMCGTDKGIQVRDYFIECEKMLRDQASTNFDMRTLEDPEFLIQLLTKYATQNKALKSTVAEQAPKVAALNRIATFTDGSLCITDAAKALQIRPKVLFLWMQEHNWIYRRTGTPWIAYQDRLKSGLLEHKIATVQRKHETDKIVEQVRVTPKGLELLSTQFSQPVMPLS